MAAAAAPFQPAFDASVPKSTRVGFIGTGIMGAPMAQHIMDAGYPLTVFTRTKSKAEQLIANGAEYAASPAEVAAASDVVCTMLGFPKDIEQVILHPETGVVANLKPGSVVIDFTTTEPVLAERIAAEASARNAGACDCPVSGGDKGAKAAKLSIFCGAEPAVLESVKPVLACLGTSFPMGIPGKGQHAKMANQVAIATTMIGLCESMVYASKAGLNVKDFLNAIAGGAAYSKSLELYADRITGGDMAPGFMVEHFVKDLGITLRECERMKISLPGLSLAHSLYLSVISLGHERSGTQALIRALETMNGS